MSKASALAAKINNVYKKLGPFDDRTAYKRTVVRTGDALIGRATVVATDTVFEPQPLFTPMGRKRIAGGRAPTETVVADNKAFQAEEYEFLFTSSQVTASDLANKDFMLVLKDSEGNEEVLTVLDNTPITLQAENVAFTVFAKSTKRPT